MNRFFIILLFSLLGFCQEKTEVFFDFNKDVPNEKSITDFNKWISENKDVTVLKVYGYCDSIDNKLYNKELATRRINSILKILNENAIAVDAKVELKPIGKDFKLSKNQEENRKVEIYFSKNNPNVGITEDELIARVETEKKALNRLFIKANEGDIVKINNIHFALNSEKIIIESKPILEELLRIMIDNPSYVFEIYGHICCNPNTNDTKLSYRRALVIFNYLRNNGIETRRLGYKGFGSANPIYPIPERNEEERIANRRVEILVKEKYK